MLALHRLDLGLEADAPVDVEFLRVTTKVVMHHPARNMFAWFHVKRRFVHRKVAVFVGANHVVGLETRVQSMFGPYPTDRRGSFQDDDIGGGVDLDVSLCGSQSMPSCRERIDSCQQRDPVSGRVTQIDGVAILAYKWERHTGTNDDQIRTVHGGEDAEYPVLFLLVQQRQRHQCPRSCPSTGCMCAQCNANDVWY